MRLSTSFVPYLPFSVVDLLARAPTIIEGEENGILIIRADATIGDFIIWLDSAKEYKKNHKAEKITLLCDEKCYELAKHTLYFDEIITVNMSKFLRDILYRYNFIKKIKEKKFTKVISPIYSRNFYGIDWIIKNINAKEKIGNSGDLSNISFLQKKISNKWYTRLITTSKFNEMELTKNAEFIRNLYLYNYQSNLPIISIEHNSKYQNFCAIFLGTAIEKKRWSVENFCQVATQIPDKISILLLGTSKENIYGEEFTKIYKGKNTIVNLIGKCSLIETLAILGAVKFVVGNDSAGIHMAVAMRTPSICILGGGHFGRFMPYVVENSLNKQEQYCLPNYVISDDRECFGCNWNCRYDTKSGWRCVNSVPAHKVIEKLKEVLKTTNMECMK